MLKKKRIYIFIAITLFVLIIFSIMSLNPLRGDVKNIRKNMLSITPKGTIMEDVIDTAKEHRKWEIEWVDYEYGYGIDSDGCPGEGNDNEIGEKSIRICIGEYSEKIIIPVYVIVYYGFDEHSRLIDIAVRKDT